MARAPQGGLHTLTERAAQLGLEPAFAARVHDTAAAVGRAWKAWRAVTEHWDTSPPAPAAAAA